MPLAIRLATLLLLLAVSGAQAQTISVGILSTRVHADSLIVSWSIGSLLDDSSRRSLEGGVGADLRITLELWKKRRLWFSRLEASRTIEFSAGLDERNRRFVLRERSGRLRAFETLDDLEHFMASEFTTGLAPVEEVAVGAKHFVSVAVVLEPLTEEAMRRIEWWMAGEENPDREGGLPGSGLTRRLIGIVADLSGFGDRVARARTPNFRPMDLVWSTSPFATPPPIPEDAPPGG